MKANELMIDDWVRNKRTKDISQVFEVDDNRFIINHECCDEYWGYCNETSISIDDVEPILLTADILEKNGWEWHDADAKFFSETWVGSLLLRKEEEGFRILAVSDYDDEDTNDTPFTIRYVHELQHALRLMGTEKEIEL